MKPKTEKLLDEEFSKYVRMTHADRNGLCTCYTCPTVAHWKDMDNGHFQLRKNRSTRWDVDNCRPQCKSCNQFHDDGKKKEFEDHLRREIGATRTDNVIAKSYTTIKISEPEAQAMLQTFKQRNKALEKEFV
jgi:hypothetical protein